MPQTCSGFRCALVLAIAGSMILAACGEPIPGSNDVTGEESTRIGAVRLEGTYYPKFPPGTTRLEISLTDRRWEFSPEGAVITFSSGGPRPWTYRVDGRNVRLVGAGESTQGERRTLTLGDDNCVWDETGNASVDVLCCPTE